MSDNTPFIDPRHIIVGTAGHVDHGQDRADRRLDRHQY